MEGKEESFLAKVVRGGRVTIPYEIREKLGLKPGSRVRLRVSRDKPLDVG